MLRATEIVVAGSWRPPPADVVCLDYDHRTRRRIALRCSGGLEFLLDLAHPRLLHAGDGLRLEDGRIVLVEAAAERLLEISCANAPALARVAWHLGNRHLAAEITARAILIREDHVIADMVRGLGAQVRGVERAFSPEGGAYAALGGQRHGHHQHHDHATNGDEQD
jgi:urease accessory protein